MLSTPVAHKIDNDSRKYDSFMTCLSLLNAEQKVCRTILADASPTVFSNVLSLIGSLRDMYDVSHDCFHKSLLHALAPYFVRRQLKLLDTDDSVIDRESLKLLVPCECMIRETQQAYWFSGNHQPQYPELKYPIVKNLLRCSRKICSLFRVFRRFSLDTLCLHASYAREFCF